MRATSVSVVTPACSSATSFTRHTSFGTSPPSSREPGAYSKRDQPPRVCMLSIVASAPKTKASKNVITLKVTLRGTKPPIWRRLVMPGTMTLGDLHQAIQAAMGWHDGHLHAFTIGGEQFGDRHSVDDVADENRVTLNGLLRSPVVRFAYTYDFGDNWEHTVAFEKSEPVVEGVSYPICITGKRNCPPEECGGVWGYEEMLAILANPTHPEHAERIDWIGEEFDPDEFDLELANTMLAARFAKK